MRYNVLKTFKSENYVNRQQSPNVLSWISWILNVCVWRPVEWHLITIQHGPMTTFTCWRSLYFKVLILLFQL
jgi:proteasome lid subunit RPN8/RPN11